MFPNGWRDVDQAHLLQKVILLQLLNRTPEKPSEKNFSELKSREDGSPGRALDLQREKELAESFAFLAATTDDPKQVVAACVEEGAEGGCLTVRLAKNQGNLDMVRVGFGKMATILERVAGTEQSSIEQEQHALLYEALTLNQNRILIRLRSRHAKLRCNYKKDKMKRPKVISQLHEAINGQTSIQTAGGTPLLSTTLKDDVEKLHSLFESLENLATTEAKSSPGLEILVQIVIACEHVHDRRLLHQVLAGSSRLEPSSRVNIARTLTKLRWYSAVCRFLLQAARKYSVFSRIRISAVEFRAPDLPATELDSMTMNLIDSLLKGPKLKRLTSTSYELSSHAIKDHIRQEATLTVPVHAEIQLLFYYERNSNDQPPRIICSSKKACFLCDLFFRIHGRFIVPSTHGRVYEKWALPRRAKGVRNADKDILATLWSFVLAIEDALIRETQSTRKPYPNPSESIILHSAICSQSGQSRISARSSPASQGHGSCEDPISASKSNTVSRTGSPVSYSGKTASAAESKIGALPPLSRTSSAATIRASAPFKALPEHVVQETTESTSLQVSLTRDQPTWCELSSVPYSFEVRTPSIHLTMSQDEVLWNLWSQESTHDLVAGWGRYWLILEYLSDNFVQQGQTVPIVNLLDVSSDHDTTLDYGSGEGPRELRVYRNYDVISIMYSLQKPVEGLEIKV